MLIFIANKVYPIHGGQNMLAFMYNNIYNITSSEYLAFIIIYYVHRRCGARYVSIYICAGQYMLAFINAENGLLTHHSIGLELMTSKAMFWTAKV